MACKGGTLKSGTDNYYPNAYYKVGDLFLTTRNENPSVRFGGTWELFGKGKTLVCVDTSDSDFSTVKKTGGEKEHTLTVDEMPKHNHDINVFSPESGNTGRYTCNPEWNNKSSDTSGIRWIGMSGMSGKTKPHNNLQPYITCYIWIRIK